MCQEKPPALSGAETEAELATRLWHFETVMKRHAEVGGTIEKPIAVPIYSVKRPSF